MYLKVFADIKGTIDPFYSHALTKQASETVIAQLPKQFGSGKAEWVKNKLSCVTGSLEYLRDVEKMIILESLKLVPTQAKQGSSGIVERSVKIENMPYMTDDVEQFKAELNVYFKEKHRIQLEELICPFKGSMQNAVAVFRNATGNWKKSY